MQTSNSNAFFILIALFTCLFSCSENKFEKTITDIKDYQYNLSADHSESIEVIEMEYAFWNDKLVTSPRQYPYMLKMAKQASLLFRKTGKVEYLQKANDHYEAANTIVNNSNSGILRSMGKCYITQHEFQKANSVLLKAKVLGDKMDETNKMLFDVKMEIGEYAEAEKYLNSIENKSSFDHLIRRSKWEDHLGNLDRAIVFMESAVKQAELKKNDELMKWSYTNLADFYGHAGKISDSYDYYLKTLKIDKTNAYALKGIAWILYSHEKNIEGAEQILTALKKWHSSPDYLILQSELAEYNEDVVQKNRWINKYFEQINKPENGKMYNKYKIKLLAEEKKEYTKSQQIADQEIILRPTPQSYCALAWTKFLAGNEKEALKIVEAKVAGKSLEPELLYQIAEIYKANDQIEKVANLKQELFESVFELGPVTEKKIMAL